MELAEVARRAASGLGADVERAVRMNLRQIEEGHETRGMLDLATAIGLASLIVQCAQFALELRRQGRPAEREDLRRTMDERDPLFRSAPETTRNDVVDRVANALSSAGS